MPYPYTLIRSKRKSLALVIDPVRGLIVRSPRLYPVSLIERFLSEKEDWIKKHMSKIQVKDTRQYSGEEILRLKSELKAYIVPRVHTLWKSYPLPAYTSIKITKSEKRWGSCSAKNGLCFSYKLALSLGTRENFIDAIIVHELAHLREKHHQKAFWDLVYTMMPDYEERIKLRHV